MPGSRLFVQLGLLSRRGFGRLTPEPFVIAVLLSTLVLVMGLAATFDDPGASQQLLLGWQSPTGLWKLLAFTMQASLMLVLGGALAAAPPVRRGVVALVKLAGNGRQLVGLTALVSIGLGVVNWSLSLICGALFARAAGVEAKRMSLQLHYPILCAAGYAGLMVWHGGLSGTAPLKSTTTQDMIEIAGPELAAQVGTLPLDITLFGSLNLVVTGGLLILGPLLFMALTPRDGDDPKPMTIPDHVAAQEVDEEPARAKPKDRLEALEQAPWVTWLLALPMAVALGISIGHHGIARIGLNTVNLTLWLLALLMHRRPDRFVTACGQSIKSCTGIFILFPLYAGIMGLLTASGLSVQLSEWFAHTGSAWFSSVTFFSAGLLNMFVPSGGGQWAIQGPILLSAALERGLAPENVMMAMAYGDQWSNMLQPFWAVPLLAITGVRARDIVGYSVLWMLFGGLWMVGCLIVLT